MHASVPVMEAALSADAGVGILAVTVLTSSGEAELKALRYPGTMADLVQERASEALRLGCTGVVASAQEATHLRQTLGTNFRIVTPGIRSAGAASHDQKRISTPGAALLNGADYLVIGRPIRDAADPLAANAWYWLGESYYVTQNFDIAEEAFRTLLTSFPASQKAPDALLKIGYCQYELRKWSEAETTLTRVVETWPDTEAARLAERRLRALRTESRR